MEKYVHTLTAGEMPNEVHSTASSYLRAAETLHEIECKRTGFWDIQSWYVIHHLSFISVEVYLKSFKVTIESDDSSEDAYYDGKLSHAYFGHNPQLDKIDYKDRDALESYLTEDHWKMIESITSKSNAFLELTKGRYPYDEKNGPAFPSGESGKLLAESWMGLAQALSKFGGHPDKFKVDD